MVVRHPNERLILPTVINLRELATQHQTKDIAFINNILMYVGNIMKDSAQLGKFVCIAEIPPAMAFYPNIKVDITVTIIVKKLRMLGYDVKRIGETKILISWGQKYASDNDDELMREKDLIKKMKKKILYDKLGITSKSNPVTKGKYKPLNSGLGSETSISSLPVSSLSGNKYKRKNPTMMEMLLKKMKDSQRRQKIGKIFKDASSDLYKYRGRDHNRKKVFMI